MSRASLQLPRISSPAFVRVRKSPRAHLIPRLSSKHARRNTVGRSIIILGIVFKLCKRETGIDIGPRCVDSVMSSTVLDCIPANSRHLQRQMGCDDLRWDAVYRCKFIAQNATCALEIELIASFPFIFLFSWFYFRAAIFRITISRNTIIQKRYKFNWFNMRPLKLSRFTRISTKLCERLINFCQSITAPCLIEIVFHRRREKIPNAFGI